MNLTKFFISVHVMYETRWSCPSIGFFQSQYFVECFSKVFASNIKWWWAKETSREKRREERPFLTQSFLCRLAAFQISSQLKIMEEGGGWESNSTFNNSSFEPIRMTLGWRIVWDILFGGSMFLSILGNLAITLMIMGKISIRVKRDLFSFFMKCDTCFCSGL